MSVERSLLSEPFEAEITSIRFHSAMHSLVNFEVVLHRKPLSALLTLKRPLSGMRPDVVLQTVYIQWVYTSYYSPSDILTVHRERVERVVVAH